MRYIGPHVSISGGVFNAPQNAYVLGATGFGMFVKNQRQWQAAPLGAQDVKAFGDALAAQGYTPDAVLPHAGYLINLANPDDDKQAQALESLVGELKRCEALGLKMLNMHPGSHLKLSTAEAACARIAGALNRALDATAGVKIVLENTAGSGGTMGSRLEELAAIIDGVEDKARVGVCIDTAHTYAAGYDIGSAEGVKAFFAELDKIVGLKYLSGMHLNDSKPKMGSHVDRHESLGLGTLGLEPFKAIMSLKCTENIPLILETPDESKWAEEIKFLTGCVGK